MSDIKIYLKYKLWSLRNNIKNFAESLEHTRTWWNLYAGFFFALAILYWLKPHEFYGLAAIISFFIMILLTITKDIKSGAHTGWWRKQHYKRKSEEWKKEMKSRK